MQFAPTVSVPLVIVRSRRVTLVVDAEMVTLPVMFDPAEPLIVSDFPIVMFSV